MRGNCHCGAVSIKVPGPPAFLNECNCSACYKLGAMWGYYTTDQVDLGGRASDYVRRDLPEPKLVFHSCTDCGSTTHYTLVEAGPTSRVGINMRMFDPAELIGVEHRFGDRRNHPQGPHYYRPSVPFNGVGAKA